MDAKNLSVCLAPTFFGNRLYAHLFFFFSFYFTLPTCMKTFSFFFLSLESSFPCRPTPEKVRMASPIFRKTSESRIEANVKRQTQMSAVLELMIEDQAHNSNLQEVEAPAADPQKKKSRLKLSFSKRDY